MLLASKL